MINGYAQAGCCSKVFDLFLECMAVELDQLM